MDEILDDPSLVRGVIYCVEHIATGKKYIGQTRSHRENHGRYRPFGAEGRFRDHISCALRNTKVAQCTALYNDIRQHGRDAFKWSQLEECSKADADQRERHWIAALHAEHPNGYNLRSGGRAGGTVIATMERNAPLNPPGQRGGCTSRSAETRAKMSARSKAFSTQPDMRQARADSALQQHAAAKAARFASVSIDPNNLDKYIFTKGARVFVRVGDAEASFAGKDKTREENIQRAKEFLQGLLQTATLPNCSGNP